MRTLLAFVLLASTCFAQPAKQPDDAKKYWLTVITHADWAKRPNEKALIENLQKEPFLSVARTHRFNHYTTAKKIYAERYEPSYPEESLPVVIRQRPDGGYVYKASGQNVPTSAESLLDEMKFYANLTPSEGQTSVTREPVDTEDEEEDSERPWKRPNIIDEDALPDSVAIFGGGTPIRDSLGFSAQILTLVAVCGFLLLMSLVAVMALKVMK
jgi:hypothetical protein